MQWKPSFVDTYYLVQYSEVFSPQRLFLYKIKWACFNQDHGRCHLYHKCSNRGSTVPANAQHIYMYTKLVPNNTAATFRPIHKPAKVLGPRGAEKQIYALWQYLGYHSLFTD